MKIFISSLIGGMTEARRAARGAIEALGHDAVMAEDFQAGPTSPQVACLAGLRSSAAVVLILGQDYGTKQVSGLSATHEEYREAKGSRPVFAFRQGGTTPDPEQSAFIEEVEGWEAGVFRGEFSSEADLGAKITRALHQWEVSRAASPLDEESLIADALAHLPAEIRGYSQTGVSLWISIAAGPRQAILRPSEIESQQLRAELMKEALFGANAIFDPKLGSDGEIRDDGLVVYQDKENALVRLTGQGDILIKAPVSRSKGDFVVVEEDATITLQTALGYAAWVLNRLDQTERLSHVAIAVALRGSEMIVWRTQEEDRQSPTSYSIGMGQRERKPVQLTPPVRTRASLTLDSRGLTEDLITLIRRQTKG